MPSELKYSIAALLLTIAALGWAIATAAILLRSRPGLVPAAVLGTAIAASMGIGYAIGAQPHMTASIVLLQSARAELAAATPNKGGHREKAMGLIDQAIGEVRAGMAFAGG